jgi:hypothetical protein
VLTDVLSKGMLASVQDRVDQRACAPHPPDLICRQPAGGMQRCSYSRPVQCDHRSETSHGSRVRVNYPMRRVKPCEQHGYLQALSLPARAGEEDDAEGADGVTIIMACVHQQFNTGHSLLYNGHSTSALSQHLGRDQAWSVNDRHQ